MIQLGFDLVGSKIREGEEEEWRK